MNDSITLKSKLLDLSAANMEITPQEAPVGEVKMDEWHLVVYERDKWGFFFFNENGKEAGTDGFTVCRRLL